MPFLRRSRSEREKALHDSCAREEAAIKGRVAQAVREAKQRGRLATKRLRASCKSEARELRQYERGKVGVPPARRKKTVRTAAARVREENWRYSPEAMFSGANRRQKRGKLTGRQQLEAMFGPPPQRNPRRTAKRRRTSVR